MEVKMFCPKCGNEIKDSVVFCGKCGMKVGNSNAVSTSENNGHKDDKKGSSNRFLVIVLVIIMVLCTGIAVLGALVMTDIFDESDKSVTEDAGESDESDESDIDKESSDDSDSVTSGFENANVGDHIKFGKYEQDNNTSNGKENIEWIVLDKKDGRILVISRYCLDYIPYDDQWGNERDVTWETCTLRKWLNVDFMNEAFSSEEQSEILTTSLVNLDSLGFFDDGEKIYGLGGNDTNDKVFLLNTKELNSYFLTNTERTSIATQYARTKVGSYACGPEGQAYWWTRQIGNYQTWGTYVGLDGTVESHGIPVFCVEYAVRPAMWIEIG